MFLRRRGSSGFSMMELVVSTCILWLLMAAALKLTSQQRQSAHLTRCASNLKVLMAAREMYAVDRQNAPLALAWPPTGTQSVTRLLAGTAAEKRALLPYIQQDLENQAFTCPSSRTECYELIETYSTSYLGGTIRCTAGNHRGCAPNFPQLVEGSGRGVQYAP